MLSLRRDLEVQVPPEQLRTKRAHELGLAPSRLAVPQQVHGAKVAEARGGHAHMATDGLFTNDPLVVLTLRVADCAPVYIYHAPSGYRGLVHAGWRGTAAGVLAAGVGWLEARGIAPEEVQMVVGPAIEMGCYEVGAEVVQHFPGEVWRQTGRGRYQLDLVAAVRHQLAEAGVPAANIASVDVCTQCDPHCHSYRRDGTEAGRMVAFFYQST